MSIYREEAIDTLIECLRDTDFPGAQIAAAETIMSLPGRFTISGKSLTRAFLLKHARIEKSYNNLVRMDQLSISGREAEDILVSSLDSAVFSLIRFSTFPHFILP